MPWWFWIITHIWVAASTTLLIHCILDEQLTLNWFGITVTVFLTMFSVPVIILALLNGVWEEWVPDGFKIKVSESKIMKYLKRFGNWTLKFPKWVKKLQKRRKDFKHIKENEDEWEAERVGIKLK